MPGADALSPEALTNIVAYPWFATRGNRFPFGDSFLEDHQRRRDAGRIFQEPNDALQPAADRVASFLIAKLEPLATSGDPLDEADTARSRPSFFPNSGVAAQLARVPSPLGKGLLVEILKRTDIRGYPYQNIAQAVIRQGSTLPADILPGLKSTWLREAAPAWVDDSTRYLLSSLATLHFFVEPLDRGLQQLNDILPDLLKKGDFWEFVRTLEAIPKEEALDVLLKLLQSPQHQNASAEHTMTWLGANMTRVQPQTLLRLVTDGTLFRFGGQQYRLERDIAPALGQVIARVPELLNQLLEALEGRTTPSDEGAVCAILSRIDDPRARSLLYRYLDDTTYPRGGLAVAQILLDKFVREERPDPSGGWYELHPHAENEVRLRLFEMASAAGPSKTRARALLLRLEENRQETGRPADEPRHPKQDSGFPWPFGLYDRN